MSRFLKLFLAIFILFLSVNQVNAQSAGDYIDNIEVRLVGGDSNNAVLLPQGFSKATTIYKTDISTPPQESYLQKYLFGGTTYEKIGIQDSSVLLETTITFNRSRLETIGGWNQFKTINIHKGCSGTAVGDQREKLNINEFISNGYKIKFPGDPDCKLDLFFQQDQLEIDFELENGSKTSFAKTGYVFDIQLKPLLNTCELQIKNEAGQIIQSAHNNVPLTIEGKNIDDGGQGYYLSLDNQIKEYYSWTMAIGGTQNVVGNGPEEFTYNIGFLSVANHVIEIKQYETNLLLCSISLPIYRDGTTPTPFSEVTKSPDQNGYIDLDIATTICDSITDPDMKAKCKACEGSSEVTSGVWTGIGCMPTNFSGIVSSLFTLFSGLMGGFVFLCLVSNGLKIMASRGNPEALKKGQEAITACLVGFVVLVLSILFLKIVGVDILDLPEWN